ncbi:hypothetical protein GCM10017744_028480 [Streptomyces antimycoticus]|uniref:Uncharacterized protein n=1 Tax=Streptomyces antimycoticus TaxID=68175 RepID=A0A4D4KBG0_9ACTN|nr:hypothetical protein [Streptomyces antimycoticus]GDY46501.1 hypothetical protein SANT12839_073830 [Streptomyces antimycoticus]
MPAANAVRLHGFLAPLPDPRDRRARRCLRCCVRRPDQAAGAFLTACAKEPAADASRRPVPRAIAVDGKTLRGSRRPGRAAIALLATVEHTGSLLAQRQVTVITPMPYTPCTTTASTSAPEAPTTSPSPTRTPGHDRVRQFPWWDIALDHYDRTRAHNRDDIRRLKTAAFAHLDASQALQTLRWRRESGTDKRI